MHFDISKELDGLIFKVGNDACFY